MIHILGTIPKNPYLACSGGVDSMSILDFLRKGKREVTCVYFNHGTPHSKMTGSNLKQYCLDNNIEFICGESDRDKNKGESPEEYWRNIRYSFFHSLPHKIITAHHLDDVVETYLFSSFHGLSKTIPYENKNIYRPFLLNRKSTLENWAKKNNIPYWEDLSNSNVEFNRNRIRHNIVPEVLKVNPGIYKTVKKLINKSIFVEEN